MISWGDIGDIQFPIDEWSCWLDIFYAKELGVSGKRETFMREWFLHPDQHQALGRIWSNLSASHSRVGLPFTLDIATEHALE